MNDNELPVMKNLRNKLRHVSSAPGVYLMKNAQGKVIYVGKARSLKKRLSSYFIKSSQPDIKTEVLINHIKTFEILLTATEQEALILESNLIKKYRPKYNVILKDDKRYPVLRINVNDAYPTLSVVRKILNDGALYFGPFSSAGTVQHTIKIINKTFKLRKCKHSELKQRIRPCLHCQMNRCLAPCCREVDPEAYHKMVKEVIHLLNGGTTDLIKNIKGEMLTAAKQQNFELAAHLRDKMFALEKIREKQVVVTTDMTDRDILAVAYKEHWSVITLMVVRNGCLIGSRHYEFTDNISTPEESLEAFIKQYYNTSPFAPKEILIPCQIDSKALIEAWLKSKHGKSTRIIIPQRGEKARLVKLALQNARSRTEEIVAAALSDQALIGRLKHHLNLPRLPKRIECVDNSNVSGTHPVAGIVVFENARPLKSDYRKYSLKQVMGPDDYASMEEVLSRRFSTKTTGSPRPDLLIVDGGKGQLNVALDVLQNLNITDIPIVAIAKTKGEKTNDYDKIYLPCRSNPVPFTKENDLILFLQRIRDEAHRFAISFHRKKRGKRATHSILDTIPGVGNKRRQQLLQHFGSVDKVRMAPLEEICGLPGLNKNIAKIIKKTLQSNNTKLGIS